MNQFIKRNITLFAVPLIILVFAGACDKDMSVVLDNSTTGDVGVSVIDSFSATTATVQMRDIPTANRGRLLVGKATQEKTGSVKSTSYFRIGFTSAPDDIPEAAVFDSINLVMRPSASRYFYGDTTKVQTIRVHRLTEALELKKLSGGIQNHALPFFVSGETLFSDQSFAYEPAAIGSLTFNPHVNTIDTLNIRLDQSLGQEFFDIMKAGDLKVQSNENFYDYFKGLVIAPDNDNTVVLGLADTLQINVNYSYTGTDGFNKTGSKILTIVDKGYQFNNVEYDRTGTAYEELTAETSLPTSSTEGLTFLQAGTGVVAKLSFPSLKEFLLDEDLSINKAELVIETVPAGNRTMYPYSPTAALFIGDENGVPVSFIAPPYDNRSPIQEPALAPGTQTGSNGSYTFNLIQYLRNLKLTDAYDGTSLYLSAAAYNGENLFNTFNTTHLATENGKPKIKLNILYTKFK